MSNTDTIQTEKKLRPRKGRHIRVVDGRDIITGTKKEEAVTIVDNHNFPKNAPKTLHQWMLDVGLDHWVLFRHIRENARCVGKADVKCRGKKPDLYSFIDV